VIRIEDAVEDMAVIYSRYAKALSASRNSGAVKLLQQLK
jgi:hypothetical protein